MNPLSWALGFTAITVAVLGAPLWGSIALLVGMWVSILLPALLE